MAVQKRETRVRSAPRRLEAERKVNAKSKARVNGSEASFRFTYELDLLQRVETIKAGVPASLVPRLARQMGVSKERFAQQLGIARATLDRKVLAKESLSADEGARVLGVERLVGLAQAMVEDSGGPGPDKFNAAQWVAGWLEQPLPALGGRHPAELMDTVDGQRIVENLLARAQSGAFA